MALVSSAAIVAGYGYSHEERTEANRNDTVEKQRMACLGQATLMDVWQQALWPRLAGQLLFTRNELGSLERTLRGDIGTRFTAKN